MIKVSELFDVRYGHSLELNRLKKTTKDKGYPFISRKMGDNGVAAYVELIPGIDPYPAGELTCALSGNGVLSTFIQERPYYTAFHVACLKPLRPLTKAQLLFYCVCLVSNRYKYSWGRQANRTIRDIAIPSPNELPIWVKEANHDCFDEADKAKLPTNPPELFGSRNWKSFTFSDLFDLKKGRRLTKANMTAGNTPFIGAIDGNNGLTAFVGQEALHPANTITVNYNGNGVAEAFLQPVPYRCSDDVNVLYPKFELTPAIAMFLNTVIRQEKYRFSYGRKWHLERMKTSTIGLPVDDEGNPDWNFMENYINTLPFSSQL